ncbi:Sec-independent protein translocase protein TatB [Gayadomonas joobiniege]|uniref:Sec-independent protein translocase protein TatB n=1 Tax=Gayadomonas joobiniege TaxID=1234606 RepID=UPI000376FE7E|nr:Sec-independent protein translocase protein TatB [Gayadomonas joobiniege]
MLDIGFWELVIIAVLALVVLGPERLPSAIRSVMSTVRSVKQTVNNVKADINHEMRVSELHEHLKRAEEKGMRDLTDQEESAISELKKAADEINHLKEEFNQPKINSQKKQNQPDE